ncbi:hypothetical protein AVTE2539_19210 [Acidovorax sp. SUPP2539]|nr:hypothetical protein AVTE2539_19210 [Acidovorax sp. SUPP2539]
MDKETIIDTTALALLWAFIAIAEFAIQNLNKFL